MIVKLFKQIASSPQFWRDLGLSVDAAFEYPIIVGFHPMVQLDSFSSSHHLPSWENLVLQVLVFMIVEAIVSQVLKPWCHELLEDDERTAAYMATDYVVSRWGLFLSIILIQTSEWLKHKNCIGSIHFLSLWVWQIVSTLNVPSLGREDTLETV